MRPCVAVLVCAAGCGSPTSELDPRLPRTAGGGCPTFTGEGTLHDEGGTQASGPTVWKAADSPHIVANGPVLFDTPLIIEPCAVVLLNAGISLTFPTRASLVAHGTADQPILFDTAEPDQYWDGLHAKPGGSTDDVGVIDLEYVTVRHGGYEERGNENFYRGVVTAWGNDVQISGNPVTESLRLKHVTIEDSPGWGVHLIDGAVFSADSTDLTIRRMVRGPIHTGLRLAGSIPAGSYTGNDNDTIELQEDAPIETMTLRDRGVPYRYGRDGDRNDLTIRSTGTLAIEPGVTLRMNDSMFLYVDGVLDARGTAARPITFTSSSATPMPGSWGGIAYRDVPLPGNAIDHAVIDYAGGDNQSTGAFCDPGNPGQTSLLGYAAVGLGERPATQFITNTAIRNSAHLGINRGWQGPPLDFLPTNTFTAIASCKQSFPPAADGSCPASNVPCP